MSEIPTSLAPGPVDPEVTLEALARAHQSLRTAFNVTLVLVVILAGSLFVFFIRELSIARRQINELTQVVGEYERSAVPLMEDFRSKLQLFTRSHPDFLPIYNKYFGGTNLAPSTPNAAPLRAQPLSNATGVRLPPSR